MKSSLTLVAVIFSVSLFTSSCNDDKESAPPNGIAGTWVLSSMSLTGCDDDDENGSANTTCTPTNCSKITATKGGQFTVNITIGGFNETETGTYKVSGSTLEICDNAGADCSATQFQLSNSNNTLTLKETDDETGCLVTAVYKRG